MKNKAGKKKGGSPKRRSIPDVPTCKPTVGLNIKKIEQQKKDNSLPYRWDATCTCGWNRSYGGMEITASVESERHEDRCGGKVTLWKQKLLRPVTPKPRRVTIKKKDLPKRLRPSRNLPDL